LSDVTLTILISPLLLVLLAIGVPIWLSLSLTGIIGIIALSGFSSLFPAVGHVSQTVLTSIALLVIPMFIMMGNFAFAAGFEICKRSESRTNNSRFRKKCIGNR